MDEQLDADTRAPTASPTGAEHDVRSRATDGHSVPAFERGADHLHAELRWLHAAIADHVGDLRRVTAITDESYLGLVIPDAFVDNVLRARSFDARRGSATIRAEVDRRIVDARHAGICLPLAEVGERLGLDQLDRAILVVALAPALDLRYATLYGYAQNDASKRRATVDLAVALASPHDRWNALRAFRADAPLRRHRVIEMARPSDGTGLLPAQTIEVATRVVEWLLDPSAADPELAADTSDENAYSGSGELTARVARAAAHSGVPIVLAGHRGAGRFDLARRSCARRVLAVDARRGVSDPDAFVQRIARESKLFDAAIYLARAESWLDDERTSEALADRLVAFARTLGAPLFVELPASRGAGAFRTPFVFELERPETSERRTLWSDALDRSGAGVEQAALETVAARYPLTPGKIANAARDACARAMVRGVAPVLADLVEGVQMQFRNELGELAVRVEATARWEDLIVPDHVIAQLRELSACIHSRERAREESGLAARYGSGRSVAALFAGESGTGKTLAANVIARELGLVLYRIDLATVVSKYIGETEKNLRRIFQAAEENCAMLFFDEADALFAKRTEISDAHDRYANVEVAYLLQRLESYDGPVVLATNLRMNLDDAFIRRIQHLVEFPFPDARMRERILRSHMPARAQVLSDVDLGVLAQRLELSGGNIKNVVALATTLAVDAGEPIAMRHLVLGATRELQKLGKLPSKTDTRAVESLLGPRS